MRHSNYFSLVYNINCYVRVDMYDRVRRGCGTCSHMTWHTAALCITMPLHMWWYCKVVVGLYCIFCCLFKMFIILVFCDANIYGYSGDCLTFMCRVCYYRISAYNATLYYAPTIYYYSTSHTYYYSCGSRWRRRRCAATGYSQK